MQTSLLLLYNPWDTSKTAKDLKDKYVGYTFIPVEHPKSRTKKIIRKVEEGKFERQ